MRTRMTAKSANRFKLTSASVRERCVGPAPNALNGNGRPVIERLYWDTEVRGFGVRARVNGKTFTLWRAVRGRTRTFTIGNVGDLTVEQARAQAQILVGDILRGVDPNERKREQAARGTTLREAMDMHAAEMRAKECVPLTIERMYSEMQDHLGDWFPRPIAEIGRGECAQRHERITAQRGRYAANRALRHFRACYNTANRRTEGLPPNPTIAVTYNKENRRQEPLAWDALPAWDASVQGIANPIRRDLQRFILFTGLRSTDAKTVRWEHVDFQAGTVHRPRPKGGVDRAFTVPLAKPALDILRRRMLENRLMYADDSGWAFPSKNRKGQVTYVQEVKEQRYEKGRKEGFLPSPHRLRDTFATAAHEADVQWMDLKVLLNHVSPGTNNVTAGYIRPSVEHLRGCVDRVATFLLERIRGREYPVQGTARSSVG